MAQPSRNQALGVSSDRLEQAFSTLGRWIEEGLTPGVAAVIARGGRLVGEYYAGSADGVQPVRPETLFCLASITKLFTACAAMTLLEDGLLSLDEPIGDLLPELAVEDRDQLTLRRMLTHTSGLPFDLGPREASQIGETPSLEAILDQFSSMRPIVPPGSQVRYGNLSYGLLFRVVERLANEPFFEVVRKRVLDPLGLSQTFLPAPPDSFPRIARVAGLAETEAANESFNSSWWRGLGLPYGGAVGTARELARFMSACLAEEAVGGFLAPATLDLMTRNQTGDLAGGVPGLSSWARAEWGLGFELRGEKRLHSFGDLSSPEAFGHLGASGTLGWADPATGLVCVVLTNHLIMPNPAPRVARFCRFSNAVTATLLE